MKKQDDSDYKSESKGAKGGGGSSKGGGEGGALEKVMKYCWDNEFLDVFRNYFKEHAYHFTEYAEGRTEEHDLAWQELFEDYLKLYEDTLSDFLRQEGYSDKEFYAEVAAAKETATDPATKQFIHCLLASCDYNSFFRVMVQMAKTELAAGGAEAKAESKK
eukprot:CAMPEP_0113943868 /NCGR_PEP_ID=MMETSP1339-20121228/28905_1 /TAXON_ID=94617 /ORGANISM="Fibrocapsa japonica" /LENGTH=160 /DNA_ID=CAMNT_0000948847 /DNA_START=46 /DNA_END=528 /DNA_ORIENTATION=+ /assembly_acc=CAM_ASM_000762